MTYAIEVKHEQSWLRLKGVFTFNAAQREMSAYHHARAINLATNEVSFWRQSF